MKSRPKSHQLPVRRIPVHELFPQPELTRRQAQPPRRPKPQRRLPVKSLIWAGVFLGLMLTGFGIYGYWRRGEVQTPYVLLEIRALEENGHPVTAANVIVNDKAMGVTDSFGEWRRYLQLPSGDEVSVELEKKGNLSGSKRVEVPSRGHGKQDIELHVPITMKSKKSEAKALAKAPLPAPVKEKAEPKGEESELSEEDSPYSIDSNLADANDSSLGIYFDDGLNRISVTSAPNQPKAANVLDKRQQQVVRERIVPVMVNDLQNLGLTVDRNSPWKLALSYIPNGDQVGYIRAEIEWSSPFGQKEKSSFIAGFAKTYEETGRALSSLLRLHMKKTYWSFKDNGNWYIDETEQTKDFWRLKPGSVVTDTSGTKFALSMSGEGEVGRRWKIKVGKTQPCEAVRQRSRCMVSTESLREAPPLAGWTLKRVRILGSIPQNSDVYVAGFEAHPVGSNQWEFWSHSGSSLKALVVSGGRIVHSEAFVDNPGQAVILKMANTGAKANRL